MNRFLVNCVKFVALLLLLSALFLGVLLTVPNYYIRRSYFGVNTRKQVERMRKMDEPKIIILGGSNCSCGLYSPLISEHFNMPVCNTGVNYIFGLLSQLRLFEEYVHTGDIVVVFPEYQQFYGDLYLGNEELLGLLSSVYPRGFKTLTLKQGVHMLPCVPKAFEAALSMRDKMPPKDSPYTPESLNECGDVEGYDLRKYKYDQDWTPTIWGEENLQKGAINALVELDELCKTQNATLLILPPVYKAMNYDANMASIGVVWKALEEKGLPVVSVPERYRMVDSLHYDSEYHLTYDGTIKRTRLVIEDMDKALLMRYNVE